MILRAYYLVAALWAVFILLGCSGHFGEWGYWVLSLSPFAVPFLLRLALGWIIHGSDMFTLSTIRRRP